jgi:HlyD family secretion protein
MMDQPITTPTAAPTTALPAITPPAAAVPQHLTRRWLIGATVLLIVLLGGYYWWTVHREAEIHYTTTPVTSGSVTRAVTATGTVNPVLTIIIGTYVSGVIQELYCDYNTQVKKDQICAKIDPRPYQTIVDQDKASIDVARAQLEKDKANLVYAQLSDQRNAKLAAKQFTSQDAADNAHSVYEQAKAEIGLDEASIEQHVAELAAAQVNLDYTNIVSPVDGTVVSRNVTKGQTVAATLQTPTLFLIATDLTKMQVDTNVSESDIGIVKAGNKASFTVDSFPNRVFSGAVLEVRQSPQSVQNVVTYDVVVDAPNADLSLKPGMTASTQIVTDQRTNVLRVPDQALRYQPSSAAAAVPAPAPAPAPASAPAAAPAGRLWLLRDGKRVAVPVVLGLDDDSFTEIVSGDVKAGDLVIVAEQRGEAAASSTP